MGLRTWSGTVRPVCASPCRTRTSASLYTNKQSTMTKAMAMMRVGFLTKTEDARKSGSFKNAKPRSATVCSR